MAGSKLKILHLAKFLMEKTDEEHPASIADMTAHLASLDIPAERKSLYSDIAALREFGLDIEESRGAKRGYFVASRLFELPELRMLVDIVQAAPFISEARSLELIKKLGTLASESGAKGLRRQVYVGSRVKTTNKSLYYNIDGIHDAIGRRRRIAFRYFDRDERGARVYRKNGGDYTVSPAALCVDTFYYLVACDENGGFRHYRVDRMSDLRVTDTPAARLPDGFDVGKYCREIFSMFQGEKETVTLRFSKSVLNPVLDRFGPDSLIHADGDDYVLSSEVEVSPTFLGWVLSFGGDMRLVSPPDAAARLCELARGALSLYA
jgi:predicted DNA-binding transcriptional regulator YafY